MEHDLRTRPQQTASEFWRSYFAKFRRRVEDHEISETGPAPLSPATPPRASAERQHPQARRPGVPR